MSGKQQVEVTLPSGTRVKCDPETAKKLGWTEPKKTTSSK